jgi:hypothetical protein
MKTGGLWFESFKKRDTICLFE